MTTRKSSEGAARHIRITERAIVVPSALAALIAVAYFLWLFAFFELDWRSPTAQDLFDVAGESNVTTWLSGATLLASAALAIVVARTHDPPEKRWGLLGAVLLAFSIDEVGAIHEVVSVNLTNRLHPHGVLRYPWVVPGAVLVLVVGFFLVPFLLRLPTAVKRPLLGGLTLFVGSALGLELLEAWLDTHHLGTDFGNTLVRGSQEIVELGGVLLILWGMLRAAATVRLSVDSGGA